MTGKVAIGADARAMIGVKSILLWMVLLTTGSSESSANSLLIFFLPLLFLSLIHWVAIQLVTRNHYVLPGQLTSRRTKR